MHTLVFSHTPCRTFLQVNEGQTEASWGWRDRKGQKTKGRGVRCEEGGKYWLCCYFGNRGIVGANLRSPYASRGGRVPVHVLRDCIVLRVGTGTQRSSELRGPRSSGLDGRYRCIVRIRSIVPITHSDQMLESKGKSGRPLRPAPPEPSACIPGTKQGIFHRRCLWTVPCCGGMQGWCCTACFSFLVSGRHSVSYYLHRSKARCSWMSDRSMALKP